MNCLNYYFTACNLNDTYIAVAAVSCHWTSQHFSSIPKADSICSELLLWVLRIFWCVFGQKRQLPSVPCWTFPQNAPSSSCESQRGRTCSSSFPRNSCNLWPEQLCAEFKSLLFFPPSKCLSSRKQTNKKKEQKRKTLFDLNMELVLNYCTFISSNSF